MLDTVPLRRVVRVLCATEIVSWGVLFYAFPVLAGGIAAHEGWSLTTLVGTFTCAQVVAAVAGLWVGRHIDRAGPRGVMTAGSSLAVVSIVAVALAPGLVWFAVAWLLVGLAMSATLYPPAFAAVTHWAGPERRVAALTALTLVAGLASTVFAPLTAFLQEAGTWRTTYLLLAIPLAATVPLHLWGLRAPWPRTELAPQPTRGSTRSQWRSDPVLRQPRFLLLVGALTLAGFSVYAVVVNLVPLLTENGTSTTSAAIALGVGGAGQVAGRLLYAPILAKLGITSRTSLTLAAAGVTTAALAVAPSAIIVLCALSFAAGVARGIFTLLQATAVSDRWGSAGYGARSGILAAAITSATALAPWVGAALAAALGGQASAFLALAALSLAAAALISCERAAAGRFA